MNIISIGEVLWDVVGSREYLGGAALNFSADLTRLGDTVRFISAVGNDERGRKILGRMAEMGLSSRYVRQVAGHGTGIVTVSLASNGQPSFVLHRPAAYDFPELSDAGIAELFSEKPDWIYYGTLLQISPQAKRLTLRLLDDDAGARRFYDVNLRKDAYTPELLLELMRRADVVKLNDDEAVLLARMFGWPDTSLEAFCRETAGKFGWETVCITRGQHGCSVLIEGEYLESEGYAVDVVDAVGAGDAFAAAFLHGLGRGWRPERIADFANRVGALVASRAGAIPDWTVAEAEALTHKSYRQEPA